MGLGVAKRWGKVLKSSYEGGEGGGQATKRGWGAFLMLKLTPLDTMHMFPFKSS